MVPCTRTTWRVKRVNFIFWFIATFSNLPGNQVFDVLNESTCSLQSEPINTQITYIIHRDYRNNLLYAKCYKGTERHEKEGWQAISAYWFTTEKTHPKSKVYPAWDQARGNFSLQIKNSQSRWFYCRFGVRGTHRYLRHAGRPGHLREVVGSSTCLTKNDKVQMMWKTIPSNAKVYHVKCYQTMDPTHDQGHLLFTLRVKDRKLLYRSNGTSSRSTELSWDPGHGELSLTLSGSAYREAWYYCDFSGKGRSPYLRAFTRLILEYADPKTKEVSTKHSQSTKDYLMWNKTRDHIRRATDKRGLEDTDGASNMYSVHEMVSALLCVVIYWALHQMQC